MTRPLLTLLALILLLPACAGDDGAVDLQLGDAFSFTPAVDTTAAYFTITNEGDVDDVLLRADADGFGSVELHDTVIQGGAASMAEQEEGIAIPAGETVTLEPGGLHVMLIEAAAPITPGDEITITLTFAEAGEVELTSTVRDRSDDDPPPMQMDMDDGVHGKG